MSRRLLVGVHAVTSVLDAGGALERLSVVSGAVGPKLRALLGRADEGGIPVSRVDRRTLDRLAEGGNHQGVVGVAPPYAYAGLDDVAGALKAAGGAGLVLGLDGVQGVLIPMLGACDVTPAAERAAAGAASRVRVARVVNLAKALDHLKDRAGAWVATADARGGQDPSSADPPRPLVLVLGSEGKGVRPGVSKRADLSFTLPLMSGVESLNVSVAAAVLLYALKPSEAPGTKPAEGV